MAEVDYSAIFQAFRAEVADLNKAVRASAEATRDQLVLMERELRKEIHQLDRNQAAMDGTAMRDEIDELKKEVEGLKRDKAALIAWVMGAGASGGGMGALISYLTGG